MQPPPEEDEDQEQQLNEEELLHMRAKMELMEEEAFKHLTEEQIQALLNQVEDVRK